MGTQNGKYTAGQYALTPKEYEKLLTVCRSIEEEALIKVAVSLGLRRADIAALLWCNIDLVSGTVTFVEHKKRDRIRTVNAGPQLRQALTKLKNVGLDKTFVFPYCERTLYNILQKLCDRADIPRRPFHALRATCIKRCQMRGWSPEQVSKLTGDTIRVIQEHYTTPSQSEMAEVAETKEVI